MMDLGENSLSEFESTLMTHLNTFPKHFQLLSANAASENRKVNASNYLSTIPSSDVKYWTGETMNE